MPAVDPAGSFLRFSGRGTIRANNDCVLTRPRMAKLDGTTRALLYCHGAGGKADAWSVHGSGEQQLVRMLAARYYVLSDDWAGGLAWGNDNAVADMNAANTLFNISGAASGARIVSGGSMGGLQSIRYAARYPAQVAGLCLVIPALNINEIRTYIPSARADQDTAWGTTFATQPTIPEPVAPSPSINHLTLAAQIQCPVFIARAQDDAIVYYWSADDFAAAVNANAYPAAVATVVNLGNLGHTDAAVAASVVLAEKWLSQTFPQDIR
jgi:pimeloyl-ACP methyl ester carboxylesterase